MATRGVQQVVTYLAWDTSANAYKTGDVANHTTSWVKDGTRAATTNSAAEVDSTNCPGMYKVTLTATETDCLEGVLGGKSSTANIVLIPTMVAFDQIPNAVPGAAGGLFIAGTNAPVTITGSGDALTISSTGGNGVGLKVAGNGSGDGIKSTGGATGAAFELVGGGTSGDGLKITTTSGHGMNIAATGTSMHGITATGGNAGTSDGIKGVAGTGGVDIRGNITGNVTGNLSGSVGSVTGAVGSVTGAVGSVTGNVGGNVVGSVASVTGNVGGNVVGSVASVTARVTANTDQLNGDATAAANVAKTTRAIGRGTVTTGGSTTSIPTSAFSPSGSVADQFKGRIITFDADTTTAALRGQSTDITASSNSATPTFTVTALTTAPASGDTFSVT